MFRKMMRTKQALTERECVALLREQTRGVLSVLGDDGYPYGMPMNHWYCPEDGRLYFHSGKKGHRSDALRRCGKVSYCVTDQGFRREGEWALNVKSVIVFGRAEVVEDHQRALEVCRCLSRKFTDDEAYIDEEIRRAGAGVMVFALVPEHISGKLVNES